MTCLAPEQLAALAAGPPDAMLRGDGAAGASLHVQSCVRCRRQLDEQRQLRALVARMPAPVLTRSHRDALAAEVMARADALPVRRRSRSLAVAVASAAAAAALALLAGDPIELGSASRTPGVASAPRTPDNTPGPDLRALSIPRTPDGIASSARTPDLSGPRTSPTPDNASEPRTPNTPPAPAAVAGSNARFTRASAGGRDVVDLHDGEITIDARRTAPVAISLGATGVEVAKAKVSVVARRGVIQSVTVFAGSAQLTTGGRHQVIEAGTVWRRETLADPRPATPAPTGPIAARPEPATPTTAAAAFRDGWQALRAQRYADAIAAFDRASDPVVAEDATYWAAIAAERAGDREAALRRMTDFLSRFPGSPRAGAARAALDKLSPPP